MPFTVVCQNVDLITHMFQPEICIVNLGQLNDICQDGQEVTKEFLIEKGVIKAAKSKKELTSESFGKWHIKEAISGNCRSIQSISYISN